MIDLARRLTEAEHRLRDRPDVIFGDAKSRRVWIDEVELSPEASWELRIHSPDGFNWSYSGSDVAQLTLAVLYMA